MVKIDPTMRNKIRRKAGNVLTKTFNSHSLSYCSALQKQKNPVYIKTSSGQADRQLERKTFSHGC